MFNTIHETIEKQLKAFRATHPLNPAAQESTKLYVDEAMRRSMLEMELVNLALKVSSPHMKLTEEQKRLLKATLTPGNVKLLGLNETE